MAGVCVLPGHLPLAAPMLSGSGVALVAVCGLIDNDRLPGEKADEAVAALSAGADEIELALSLSLFERANQDGITREVRMVRRAVGDEVLLRVILWTDPFGVIPTAARAAIDGGADAVQTSVDCNDVTTMPARRSLVPQDAGTVRDLSNAVLRHRSRFGIKVAGGVGDFLTALAMLEAGAARVGTPRPGTLIRDFELAQSSR